MWQTYAILANQKIQEQQADAERARRARLQPAATPRPRRRPGRLRTTHGTVQG